MKLLSEAFYYSMEALKSQYPEKRALLLPAFHAAQEEHGWLSPEILAEIAHWIGIHPAVATEVASFYTMFYLKPMGRSHVKICTNVACMLRGAEDLLSLAQKKLNIGCGETSQDGRFSLDEEECVGACGSAPVVLVNDDYHENVTAASLDALLEELPHAL